MTTDKYPVGAFCSLFCYWYSANFGEYDVNQVSFIFTFIPQPQLVNNSKINSRQKLDKKLQEKFPDDCIRKDMSNKNLLAKLPSYTET